MNTEIESSSADRPGGRPAGRRRALLWAAGLVFLTAGYFQNSRPGWNVNSQYALTCAIVERGTFQIDAYHARQPMVTEDKAFFKGHYYSDKSPVTAMIGTPAFALYRMLAQWFDLNFSYHTGRYWTTWWTAGLAAAALAALTAVMLMRHGVGPGDAAKAGALWVAATPLMGYAILFQNYTPACAMAMGGFLLIERVWRERVEISAWRLGAAGFLLGLATWTLNTMAIVALALTVTLFLAPLANNSQGGRWRRRWQRLWPWAVGGLAGFSGYFIYTYAIFGSFASPYAYEADAFFKDQMARGLMGATRPRPLVAWLITFHPFHGLFFWFPLTTAALAGILGGLVCNRKPSRRESALALAILVCFVIYTSAYFMWWGGLAYAPRHLIPVLPFLAFGLLACLMARYRWMAGLLFAIGLVGGVLNLAAIAVDPQPPPDLHFESDKIKEALPQSLLMRPEEVKHWSSPFLGLQKYFWVAKYTDTNWGTGIRLHGPVSLAPLAALWALGWWGMGRRRWQKPKP